MKEHALQYLKEGKPVFPVGPDKKPLVPWKSYQDIQPPELQVNAWWTMWPDANIGMATGKLSGIIVIDADSQESATRLANEHPEARQTLLVKTGRGWHIYFQYREGIRNSAGKFAPGLDVRGEGGYVLLPPSKHETGAVYQWMNSNILPLPEALAEKLLNGDPVYKGQRNDVLFRYGAGLRSKGFEEEAILTSLTSENDRRCKPPLPEREIQAITKSIIRYPAGTRLEDIKPYGFTVIADKELLITPALDYLWGNVLISNGIGLIVGQPGAGKSLFGRNLAYAVATGEPFLGYPICRGVAIYLSLEESRAQVAEWRRARNPLEIPNLFTVYDQSPNAIRELEPLVKEYQARLLVIDILGKFMDIQDINKDYVAVSKQLRIAAKIAHQYNCCILLTHHAGWGAEARSQGTTALMGGVDIELVIVGRENQEYRTLKTSKQRSGFTITGLTYTKNLNGATELYDLRAAKISEFWDEGMAIYLANPGISQNKFCQELGRGKDIGRPLYKQVRLATLEVNKNNNLRPEKGVRLDPLVSTIATPKKEEEDKDKIKTGIRKPDAQRLPEETLEAYALRLKTIFPDTILDWRLELDRKWKNFR